MRSEDNLAPPLREESLHDVSCGASPFQNLHDVRDGDRPDTLRAPEPQGGKDVSVCLVTGTIDNTKECAALDDVHDSFEHRLNHHWDILGHVDGSATVRENGCLSTATSSTENGSLATTIPSVRGRGATCAKVWNAIRRDRSDCIFLKGDK